MQRIASQVHNRSLAGQLGHWIKIGQLAKENPDLRYTVMKDILSALGKSGQA